MDSSTGTVKTSVIIPAFNEEDGLKVVLEKLFGVLDGSYEVIVVDDGSTDRTALVARQFPCRLIQHEVNKGKGEALKTGIQQARTQVVIWLDADDTYPVDPIPEMAAALHNSYDLVFASRKAGLTHIPRFNRLGNTLFRWSIRTFYGFRPHDPTTGLCGVRKEALVRMNLQANKFAIEPEIAMKAGRLGLRMLDMPIEYRTRIGQAKLNAVKVGFEDTFAILGHLWWRPRPLIFIVPGILGFLSGSTLLAVLIASPITIGEVTLTVNSFILAAMLALGGVQLVALGLAADLYVSGQTGREPGLATKLFLHRRVGGSLGWLAVLVFLAGVGLLAWIGAEWVQAGFGAFGRTRLLVLGSFLSIFGMHVGFASSFLTFFAAEQMEVHRAPRSGAKSVQTS